jgi:Flp pilus assembly protein TadD
MIVFSPIQEITLIYTRKHRLTYTMPDTSTAAFEEGKTLFGNRHYDDAIDKFREALRQDPARSE